MSANDLDKVIEFARGESEGWSDIARLHALEQRRLHHTEKMKPVPGTGTVPRSKGGLVNANEVPVEQLRHPTDSGWRAGDKPSPSPYRPGVPAAGAAVRRAQRRGAEGASALGALKGPVNSQSEGPRNRPTGSDERGALRRMAEAHGMPQEPAPGSEEFYEKYPDLDPGDPATRGQSATRGSAKETWTPERGGLKWKDDRMVYVPPVPSRSSATGIPGAGPRSHGRPTGAQAPGDWSQPLAAGFGSPVPEHAKIEPGQYHVKTGARMGKAHMVVHDNGAGEYVNSRGERKPLSAAQVRKNHASGMSHLNTLVVSGESTHGIDDSESRRTGVTRPTAADFDRQLRGGAPARPGRKPPAVRNEESLQRERMSAHFDPTRSQTEMDRYFNGPYGKTPSPLKLDRLTDAHLQAAFQTMSSRYQSYIWQAPDRFKQGVANRMEALMAKMRTEAGVRGIELGSGAGPPPSAVFR